MPGNQHSGRQPTGGSVAHHPLQTSPDCLLQSSSSLLPLISLNQEPVWHNQRNKSTGFGIGKEGLSSAPGGNEDLGVCFLYKLAQSPPGFSPMTFAVLGASTFRALAKFCRRNSASFPLYPSNRHFQLHLDFKSVTNPLISSFQRLVFSHLLLSSPSLSSSFWYSLCFIPLSFLQQNLEGEHIQTLVLLPLSLSRRQI